MKEANDDEYVINSEEDEDEEKKLPSYCFICRELFKNPVVTKWVLKFKIKNLNRCKHYFCESCALDQFRKSKKCAVCGVKTDGSFAIAKGNIFIK